MRADRPAKKHTDLQGLLCCQIVVSGLLSRYLYHDFGQME